MSKLTRAEIYKILSQPLGKKIDQRAVERWSAAYWSLPRQEPMAGKRKPFVMMFPPPNITGSLHLGHALTGAIQDALVRQRRMLGENCLFIPGFDHAGLATQNIVEKQLWKKMGITRKELGREKFIEMVNEWKDTKRTEMRDQLDRLGLDLNREREYFTMDQNSSHAVHAAFKQLFASGIIYRSMKLIFWSEKLQTTLSDIEVEQVDGQHRYTRTGEPVEKRPVSQWFINAEALAKRAVEVVNDGSIEMIPPNYKRSWSSWLLENGVQDWCISRQSWWGHRIPAYKVEEAPDHGGNWIIADSLSEAKAKLGRDDGVMQDPDVLDTWFSSSLLPMTISGWPDRDKFDENCRSQHFPLHIMETGFDILTYWVSKMTMISLALTNRIPFKMVLLHGMICDSGGKKMSKSLGNVIDPLDVIDGATLKELQSRTIQSHSQGILEDKRLNPVLDIQKSLFPKGIPACGADGLRAYLLSHDVQEEVVRVQIAQIEKVRRLSNKIWNIFRFFFILTDPNSPNGYAEPLVMDIKSVDQTKLDDDDQQVLEEMAKCVQAAHVSFHETYQLQHCFNHLEGFIIKHLSQTYMEQARSTLMARSGDMEVRKHKLQILATCLLTSTRLLHPYMPHLTEFLYQKLITHGHDFEQTTGEDTPTVLLPKLLSYEPFPQSNEWTSLGDKLNS